MWERGGKEGTVKKITGESTDYMNSAADPWHFGTDPDRRIRTTDLRIRILLFLQWLMQKKGSY